jgi:hypothetical protein
VPKIKIEILGDASRAERAFRQTSAAASAFDVRMKGLSAGISQAFKTMTVGLVGGYGLEYAFRKVTDASREHAVVQGHCAAGSDLFA